MTKRHGAFGPVRSLTPASGSPDTPWIFVRNSGFFGRLKPSNLPVLNHAHKKTKNCSKNLLKPLPVYTDNFCLPGSLEPRGNQFEKEKEVEGNTILRAGPKGTFHFGHIVE